MGKLVLSPTAILHKRGTYEAVGAASELDAIQDTNDASYIHLKSTFPTYPYAVWGASILFYFQNQAMPSGARVVKVYHVVRLKKGTTAARTARIRVFEVKQWRFKITVSDLGTDFRHAASYPLATSARDITGPKITKRLDGSAITAPIVGRLGMEIFQFFHETVQIIKANINVEFDEKPQVTSIEQDGDEQSISSPLISWEYFDDLQPQYAYRVVLAQGSSTIYDSNKVYTSDQFHQITQHLPDGTYDIKVQVAQVWKGPGGEFWSEWRYATFTIKSQVPAPPSVNATADSANGRIIVDILSNLNKMSYESAHMDFRTGPAIVPVSLVNCTVADETTETHSGNYSLAATLTNANPAVPIDRGYQPAVAGTVYKASAYVKPKTGSTTLTATCTIVFRDSGHTIIGSTAGTGVPEVSSSTWAEITATATAPANTAYVDLKVSWSGGSAAQVHLIDDCEIRVFNANFADPTRVGGTSRGGMFEPDVPNMYTYEDSSGEMTPISWGRTNGIRLSNCDNADISVDGTQAWHGESSILMAADGGGTQTGFTDNVQYAVVPGEVYFLRYFVKSAVSARTFHHDVDFLDQDQVFISSANTGNQTSSTTAWVEVSGTVTVPAGASIMMIGVHCPSTTVDGELHYFDGLQLSKVSQDPGFVPGFDTSAGPYTTIEYSEDAGTTWAELTTIDAAAEARTFYDGETGTGIQRRYRAFNWKVVEGQTIISSKSADTADVSITVTQIFLHAEDDPTTLYGFLYWTGGRTDTPDTLPTLSQYVGREYPMATYGELRSRIINGGVGLPSAQDRAAFLALANKKTRIMYRDRQGRRAWVTLTNISITDRGLGEQVATFDAVYTGNQP